MKAVLGQVSIPSARGYSPIARRTYGTVPWSDEEPPLTLFPIVPASARMFLSKLYFDDAIPPKFDHISAAQNHCVLGLILPISFSINGHAAQLRENNICGGVLDAEVDELYNLSRGSLVFRHFIRSSFDCGRVCPGFRNHKGVYTRHRPRLDVVAWRSDVFSPQHRGFPTFPASRK